jgi:hypothetical protein
MENSKIQARSGGGDWGRLWDTSSEGDDGSFRRGMSGARRGGGDWGRGHGQDSGLRRKKREDKADFEAVIFYRMQYTLRNNTTANIKWAKDVSHARDLTRGSGNSFRFFQTYNPNRL